MCGAAEEDRDGWSNVVAVSDGVVAGSAASRVLAAGATSRRGLVSKTEGLMIEYLQ